MYISIRVKQYVHVNSKSHVFKQNLIILYAVNLFTGKKFGFDVTNAIITDEEGSEIDSIEVIRDGDKLFVVEDTSSLM